MERPGNDDDNNKSNFGQILVMIGLALGSILAAWLLVEALEYLS